MAFVDRITPLSRFTPERYLQFSVDGVSVGLVDRRLIPALEAFPDTFVVSSTGVSLRSALSTPEARTEAVEKVLLVLAGDGWLPGWRNERYPVAEDVTQPVLFEMERAAIPLFGIRACGVHVNGIVRHGPKISMWIGRRSRDKRIEPGKLDQMVAGGQHAGLSTFDTLIKEAAEEANLSRELAMNAVSVGAITYRTERPEGLRRDVLYVFDLELPPTFQPRNTDGEMEDFFLWPLEKVIDAVENTDQFKFNCGPVIIDFLIRHGHLGPDHADYLAIIRALHGD